MLVLSIQVVLIPKIFPDTSLGLGWINDEGMAEHCLQLGSIGFSITCHLQVFLDSRDFLPGNLSDLEDVQPNTSRLSTVYKYNLTPVTDLVSHLFYYCPFLLLVFLPGLSSSPPTLSPPAHSRVILF